MKHIVTILMLVLLHFFCATGLNAQKGVAINKATVEPGLILDVEGKVGADKFGVRFTPIDSRIDGFPSQVEGSLYYDLDLNTYRQYTGTEWQNLFTPDPEPPLWTFNGNSTINSILYNGNVGVFGDFFLGAGKRFVGEDGFQFFPTATLTNGITIAADGAVNVTDNLVSQRAIYTPFLRAGSTVESPLYGGFNFVADGKSWLRGGLTYVDNLILYNPSSMTWHEVEIGANGGIDPRIVSRYNATAPAPSDRHLKEDVSPINGALLRIQRLNGVNYHWNSTAKELFTKGIGETRVPGPGETAEEVAASIATDKATAKNHYAARETGLIAQDLQKVLPEAVVEAEDGYLRVKYGHLAGLFVEAIKEQQAIIDAQAERIRQLEARQLGVLARLEKLEANNASGAKASAEE